jgi:hypothetical protein
VNYYIELMQVDAWVGLMRIGYVRAFGGMIWGRARRNGARGLQMTRNEELLLRQVGMWR